MPRTLEDFYGTLCNAKSKHMAGAADLPGYPCERICFLSGAKIIRKGKSENYPQTVHVL